jgi:hypothetical protein
MSRGGCVMGYQRFPRSLRGANKTHANVRRGRFFPRFCATLSKCEVLYDEKGGSGMIGRAAYYC